MTNLTMSTSTLYEIKKVKDKVNGIWFINIINIIRFITITN